MVVGKDLWRGLIGSSQHRMWFGIGRILNMEILTGEIIECAVAVYLTVILRLSVSFFF